MKNEILESQGSKYYDENPAGTNEYLYLWAALDKFGRAQYPDWTGREVFLQDTYAFYNKEKKEMEQWCRHKTWQELQRLKRVRPESSWRDILENKRGLSQEDTKNYDYSQLAKIVEDWERFDKAKRDLQSAFGDGRLKAYFLEDSGSDSLLKKEFWKAEHTWEAFENAEEDFHRGYKKHSVSEDNFLPLVILYDYPKKEGTICVKKDDLEKFLSGHKEEPPQPSSLEMNAETIIKFLEESGGYVSPRLKGLLMYICESALEKDAGQDKVKEAFYNWLKNNHEKCGFDKKRFEDLTSKKRKGHPQSSHEGQNYNDISRIFRL